MKHPFVILWACLLLFSACEPTKKEKLKSEIRLERWTVQGDSLSYEKGEIQYLETTIFDKNGDIEAVAYYNNNKELTGKESKVYDKEGRIIGAQFRDTQDSLLSYYTYQLDNTGKKTQSKAYDAITNELLRQETYSYNSAGKLTGKTILDSRGLPMRKFEFKLDEKGNEIEVRVLNPNDVPILIEEFKITKLDGQKNWIEKWGFVNDQPFSYLAREIEYQ